MGALAATLSACQEDAPIPASGEPLPVGTEVNFNCSLEDNSGSRTIYGEETTIDGATVWPIYWNYQTNLDQIYIYSPQGNGTRNQAAYQVEPAEANQSTASTITKLGAYGVQVGTDTNLDFYAMYPAQFVTGTASDSKISGNLPGNQTVTFSGYSNGTTTTSASVFPAAQSSTRNYFMAADMNNCIMYGKATGQTINEDNNSVSIEFSPYSTVLDITVNAETNTTITNKITAIQIVADAPIAGDFTMDFANLDATGAPTFTAGTNTSNNIMVNTKGTDADGNIIGVPLMSGNTLNVRAFLLPNPNVKTITINVISENSKYWQKNLTMTNFKPKEIHPVKLPYINQELAKMDYSIWLSQLDPRIYISEISLPGAYLHYNAANTGQEVGLEDKFNKGIRVFAAHCQLAPSTPGTNLVAADGGATCVELMDFSTRTNLTLGNTIKFLVQEMNANHSSEFCVLMLNDYQVTNTGTYTREMLLDRIKTLTEYEGIKESLVTEVTPTTTLADVKGKVIIKWQGNASLNEGGTNTAKIQNAYNKIAGWSNLNNANVLLNSWSEYSQSNVYYSPLIMCNKGLIGTLGTIPTGGTNWEIQSATNNTGFCYASANRIKTTTTTTTFGFISSVGNPSFGSVANITSAGYNMSYIYSEPNNGTLGTSLLTNVYNAYQNSYALGVYGMMFLGDYTAASTADITININTNWTSAIGSWKANTPYGWVIVGNVDGTNSKTAIEKIIDRNVNGFTLQRNKNQAVNVSNNPTQDASVKTGGALN